MSMATRPRTKPTTKSTTTSATMPGSRPNMLQSFFVGPKGFRNLLLFMLAAVVIQGFHTLEHVVQNVQVWVDNVPPPMSCGLLGCELDFPWVHFVYNSAYFMGLVWLALWVRPLGQWNRWETGSILSAAAFQAYHTFEHTLQIQQSLTTGVVRPVGLIGLFGNNIVIHTLFNLVVWIPILMALVSFARKGPMRYDAQGPVRPLPPPRKASTRGRPTKI